MVTITLVLSLLLPDRPPQPDMRLRVPSLDLCLEGARNYIAGIIQGGIPEGAVASARCEIVKDPLT